MHLLSDALPLPYVPARVTRGALVVHRHSFAPTHYRILNTAEPLSPLSCLNEDPDDHLFEGV